jgi:predicted CopG family antitoxin
LKKKNITTLTISEETHFRLYRLKRRLRKRSFDDLLRYLADYYEGSRREVREANKA